MVVLLALTDAGSAPGNGERAFDAPGCQRNEYDGPGGGHPVQPRPDCPIPRPVILFHLTRTSDGLQVDADGSHSLNPEGGRIVSYLWNTGHGYRSAGSRVHFLITHPGTYTISLVVTNDNQLRGLATQTVRVG